MRFLKRLALGLVAIVLLLLVVLYAGSEWVIRRSHAVTADAAVAIPRDAVSVTEGARLARVFGCRDCHHRDGTGSIMVEDPMLGRLAPPAFAKVTATHSDAEIVQAVRHGVHRDGSTLWIMPVHAYRNIADEDMGKVLGWMHTLKPGAKDQANTTRFGPIGRMLVLTGALKASVRADSFAPRTRPADVGRYFVETSCTGCHALDHAQPSEDGKQIVPALAPMAASYDFPAFRKLLQTGEGLSKRDLGLMRTVAIGAYSGTLTDPEMLAIHNWLKAEAERQAR